MSNDSSEEVEHVSLTTCSKEVSRPLSEISFEVTPQRVETPVPDTVERCIPSEVGDTDKKINSSAFQECISPATATSTYKTPFHPPLVPDKPADTSLETVPSDHSSLAFQEEHQKAMSSTPVSERIVADLDDSPHSDAHEEVNISTPSVSTMATNANNNSTGLQATPPSGRKVRADSSQWIASRKETLNQLRAELEEKTANHTPGRRQSHQRQTLAPPLFYEEVQPATPDPVPVHVDVSPEKPVEEEITESTPFASEEFLSPREPPTNEFSGDTSADTDVKVTEVPVANAPRNDTEMIDRNISSISNISPDKNDLVSILAALYGTPSHMARSPSPEKVLNRSGETRSPPPTSPSVPSRSPADRSVVLEKKMRREQKIRDEMKAKELAECTFHPTISPGTRAMIAIQERSKITEMDKGVPPNQTSDGTKKERRELWDSVYNRLYPDELKNAPSQKHQLDQEMDYKLEARKEMFVLRSFAGATYKSETPETAYKTFLSNLFQFDCRTASRADCVAEGVMVETPYCSPMAYALLEESNNKKKLANARRGDLTAPVKEGKEFRIALFDDFLLRQNAFHHRRRKRLHELTKAMTPDFTPSTTEQSSQLVKTLLERSQANDKEKEETTVLLKKHIPVAGKFVKRHKSKYNDECTFQPDVSLHKDSKNESLTHGDSSRFSTLHGDYQRIVNNRERAKQLKHDSELDGCTFQPRLNHNRNKNVQSALTPGNYAGLTSYLSRKRAAQEEQRQLNAAKAEVEQVEFCTFRPTTTKKPTYVSKMANDFGVLRSMNYEF